MRQIASVNITNVPRSLIKQNGFLLSEGLKKFPGCCWSVRKYEGMRVFDTLLFWSLSPIFTRVSTRWLWEKKRGSEKEQAKSSLWFLTGWNLFSNYVKTSKICAHSVNPLTKTQQEANIKKVENLFVGLLKVGEAGRTMLGNIVNKKWTCDTWTVVRAVNLGECTEIKFWMTYQRRPLWALTCPLA